MAGSNTKGLELLEQLVRSLTPLAPEAAPEAKQLNQETTHKLVQLSLRILDSQLQPTIAADDFAVSEQIKRKCTLCVDFLVFVHTDHLFSSGS